MNSTIALLINIPTLLLLYVLIYFTQALSGKRQFYGISLNSDYFDKPDFKNLDKKFKSLVTIGFILFSIITLALIYGFNAYVASSIVPMLGFCLYQFVVYVHIHNKVKNLKSELALNDPKVELEKTKVILDTKFITEKNIIINKFSIVLAIPIIAVVLVGSYMLIQYNSIPNTIPTHWGISGAPDAFADKSFGLILAQVVMMIGLSIVIYISSIYSLKSRAKLSTTSVDNSKKLHLHYLKSFGYTFLALNISCQALLITILIATLKGGNVNNTILFTSVIILVLSSIYLTYLYYKSPAKAKDAVYSIDDEDCLWIFGCLYNNPNDPSVFVSKRFGVGWTVNVGTTKGKLIFILPFVIILLSLLFLT